MRTLLSLAAVAVAASTASASDVRLGALPKSVQGTWAATAKACSGSDASTTIVSAKGYIRANAKCEIAWVTVTATPNGSRYSARSRCTDQSTGKAYPPTDLLFRAIDSNHISIGTDVGNLTPHERCP